MEEIVETSVEALLRVLRRCVNIDLAPGLEGRRSIECEAVRLWCVSSSLRNCLCLCGVGELSGGRD